MNTKHAIAAATVLAASTSAFAQDSRPIGADPLYSGQAQAIGQPKTRDEVVTELNRAREEGTLPGIGEIPTYPDEPLPKSARSRAEVQSEARQHARFGEITPDSYSGD